MIKLGFIKTLIAGVFLGFFFYETSIGNFVVSLVSTNLVALGEFSLIVIPLIIVILACLLADNKILGALTGLILGVLLFNFSLYFEQSLIIASYATKGDIQNTLTSINVILNQLKINIGSFAFIVEIVTAVSIGFSMGKHLSEVR